MQLFIAGSDLQGHEWQEEFFPDDLPDDWRLDYYANEFRAWVITPQQWRWASREAVLTWREAGTPPFAFFLALHGEGIADDEAGLAQASMVIEVLGDSLKGVLVRVARAETLEPLGQMLNEHFCGLNRVILCPEGGAADRLGPDVTLCTGETLSCHGGDLAVAELTAVAGPRALRTAIEGLLQGGQSLGVLVSDQPENLRNARIVAELMGLV